MGLRNKRVLITAGATWVAIDNVRIVSNIASGVTGILLSREAVSRGARVTLLLGAGISAALEALEYLNNKTELLLRRLFGRANLNERFRLLKFHFFDELKSALKYELKNNNYDIIIHSAAVSDFKAKRQFKGKLNSHKICDLRLVPLEKLAFLIRRLNKKATLVIFKLESGVEDKIIIQRAIKAKDEVGAELVVANRIAPYRAFIIDDMGRRLSVDNKYKLARRLIEVLDRRIGQ